MDILRVQILVAVGVVNPVRDVQVRDAPDKHVLDRAGPVRLDQVRDALQVRPGHQVHEVNVPLGQISPRVLNSREILVRRPLTSQNHVVREVQVGRVHKELQVARELARGDRTVRAVRLNPGRRQAQVRQAHAHVPLASLLASRGLGREAMIGSQAVPLRTSLNLVLRRLPEVGVKLRSGWVLSAK